MFCDYCEIDQNVENALCIDGKILNCYCLTKINFQCKWATISFYPDIQDAGGGIKIIVTKYLN